MGIWCLLDYSHQGILWLQPKPPFPLLEEGMADVPGPKWPQRLPPSLSSSCSFPLSVNTLFGSLIFWDRDMDIDKYNRVMWHSTLHFIFPWWLKECNMLLQLEQLLTFYTALFNSSELRFPSCFLMKKALQQFKGLVFASTMCGIFLGGTFIPFFLNDSSLPSLYSFLLLLVFQ